LSNLLIGDALPEVMGVLKPWTPLRGGWCVRATYKRAPMKITVRP
jgi:hypothetical protein